MKEFYCEKAGKILRNRRLLEKELAISIKNHGKNLVINGKSEREYIAEKVLDAINFGFPIKDALLIKKEGFVFETIRIKECTKRQDIKSIKARIIGRQGRTLKTLCNITGCFFELKDGEVGIIARPEDMKNVTQAIIALIRGTKTSNVYAFLERLHFREKADIDLGLKSKSANR